MADIYLPDPAAPRRRPVIFVHGGFWSPEYDRTHARPLAEALAHRGHVVVLLEYRRVPGDPDLTIGDLLLAVSACGDEVPEAAGQRPLLLGHSAGGHLVLWLASLTVEGDIVALAPVADLGDTHRQGLGDGAVEAFLGGPPDDRPDLDPLQIPPTSPTVVIHGTDDTLVPAAQSRRYSDAHGVRLVELRDVAHFQLIDPASTAWAAVIAELDR
jgi:acetyl esterase/lipase